MKALRISLLMLSVMLCGLQCLAQQKLKLAVLDPVIAGEKLTDGLAISVREIVSSSFVNNAENYAIVERSLIDKVLQEANFSNSDAVDESQATQLGKLAGADKVVLTVISRFDNRCMMSIKMIDVESATIDKQISKLVEISSLLDVTEPLTLAILGKADANAISSASGGSSASRQTAQTPQQQESQKKGGIKGLFSKKSDSSGDAPFIQGELAPITFPEFNGAGVNYTDNIINVEPQPEDFNVYNLAPILNSSVFNIVVDFSETMVMGMPLLKFLENKRQKSKKDKDFSDNFFIDMNSEVDRFVKALNDETKLGVSYYPSASITFVVKVRTVDEDGRENVSDYVFMDTNTGQVISGIRLKSKGGRFGSWTNLFGDALEEDAAPQIGKKLKSAKKKFKKL